MSIVMEKVVQSLKLEKIPRVTDVTGLGASHARTSRHRVDLTLKSLFDPDVTLFLSMPQW